MKDSPLAKQYRDMRRMHSGALGKLQAARHLSMRVSKDLYDAREEIKRLKQIIEDLCEEGNSKKKR